MGEADNLLDTGKAHNLLDSKPLCPRLCHERLQHLLVRVWGCVLGFEAESKRFGVWGLGLEVWGLGLGVYGFMGSW
jgi:hypothetical protein